MADLGFPVDMPATHIKRLSGADPGFPVEVGANIPGGAPKYDFAKFSKKLHEIENILGRRGVHTFKAKQIARPES